MSIKIEHRNLEIQKTHNDFSLQVQNFLLPLSLKVLRHKERDTHSFYSSFFICPPSTHTCGTRHKGHWPGFGKKAKANSLLPRQVSTPLTFFKIPKIFWCMMSPTLCCPHFPSGLLWHLWVTRLLCARMWTPVLMLHLSNPCTEPKGSQPN